MDFGVKRILILLPLVLVLVGCGRKRIDMPYEELRAGSAFKAYDEDGYRAENFSEGLCLVEKDSDELRDGSEDESYAAAVLFDTGREKTLYSEHAFKRLYPASMTKVLTAIVAMKNSDKDDVITCSENVKITESGAQLAGFEAGDQLTMDQAMHALLMYSANDAAVAIAEGVAGSIPDFADMMNEEAARLGAQGTHFVNPHGLHDEEHYTTAYDMYLMFNEAVKYEWFTDIIAEREYVSSYKAADGNAKELDFSTTNLFLKGEAASPDGISVLGGKTGTTMAAGNNLVLLSEDGSGGRYISVVMRAGERRRLYELTGRLLGMIS